jgi:cell division protein FtsZ
VIDFSNEGPYHSKADPIFPDRVRILGLGQTGVAVCDQIVLHGRAAQDLWAFDSDQQVIDASIVTNRHLLGRNLVHGLGSSGDLALAREIVALEEDRLNHVAEGCDFLVLVLGLAGGTGVALAEFLIEAGHRAGAKVVVIGVQPFAFEGWSRREKSIQAIELLRREADSVMVLAHDRITEHPTTAKNVRHGFHLMHQALAQTAQALAQIVGKRGLVQLSFADVRSLYGRYAGSEALENCWAAHVEGDIHDQSEDLVEHLLAGPLLIDESVWKHVDHAVAVVSGTRGLGLSDVQELIAALKDRLPKNISVATSACLEEEGHDKVRLTLLLAMTSAAPAPAASAEKTPEKKPIAHKAPKTKTQALAPVAPAKPAPVAEKPAPVAPAKPAPVKKISHPAPSVVTKAIPMPEPEGPMFADDGMKLPPVPAARPVASPGEAISVSAARKFIARQEEMQFDLPTRGRFEKTEETIHNGENLDLPTFRRRGLAIRL